MGRQRWDAIRAYALGFPQAIEDFPWQTPVVKIDHPPGRMINGFVFGPMFLWLGKRDRPDPEIAVKLTASYDEAVEVAGAEPMAYSGLGQWGWLTVPLNGSDARLLHDWIDESYRNVAPKALLAQLDATRDSSDLDTD